MRGYLVFVVMATLLSGCAAIHDWNKNLGKSVGEINKLPMDQARSYVANQTLMTYDPGTSICTPAGAGKYSWMNCTSTPGHGTQIEYFGPNGRAYLWYPGNSRAVPSLWRLSKPQDRYKICFKYPSRSYNALTREYGGRWDCRDLAPYASKVTEIREGDIFGLASRKLPFVLSSGRTTFDALLAR